MTKGPSVYYVDYKILSYCQISILGNVVATHEQTKQRRSGSANCDTNRHCKYYVIDNPTDRKYMVLCVYNLYFRCKFGNTQW